MNFQFRIISMSIIKFIREDYLDEKKRHLRARLAPHSFGFVSRGWLRSFPSFRLPVTRLFHLLVMLLFVTSWLLGLVCLSRALIPLPSSCRACPVLLGKCVRCSLYALLSAAINRLICTRSNSRLKRPSVLEKMVKSCPYGYVNGNFAGYIFANRKVTSHCFKW